MTMPQAQRRAVLLVLAASAAALIVLFWLIYFKPPAAGGAWAVDYLPGVNALLNTSSAACLLAGYRAIRRKRPKAHMRWMLAALGISALFLVSYVTYHHFHGNTAFSGTGLIRPVYFFVLISHVLLTVFALPMILLTFLFALTGSFARHRRIARYTLPVWLYISATGVLVYLLLRFWG